MTEEEAKAFCEAWTRREADPDDDPKDEPELRASALLFEHAGRYSLKIGGKGFDTSLFGESGQRGDMLWAYATSPDVCYYYGEFKTESDPAYDVALYRETFSDEEAFESVSEALGRLFGLVRRGDLKALAAWDPKRTGVAFGPDGAVIVDGSDFGLVLEITVSPL